MAAKRSRAQYQQKPIEISRIHNKEGWFGKLNPYKVYSEQNRQVKAESQLLKRNLCEWMSEQRAVALTKGIQEIEKFGKPTSSRDLARRKRN